MTVYHGDIFNACLAGCTIDHRTLTRRNVCHASSYTKHSPIARVNFEMYIADRELLTDKASIAPLCSPRSTTTGTLLFDSPSRRIAIANWTTAGNEQSHIHLIIRQWSQLAEGWCTMQYDTYNIHWLQRVQNCLARVVKPTHSATMSRSLLASLHWLPIRQRVTFKLAGLVHRSLYETSCTYTLQHDHFDLLLPTFLLNPVSELHLLLMASDLLDPEFGTLYQITSNLLPLSPRSDPDSKPTSLLQLVNNWPPSELSAALIRPHTRFCARYKCFTLHYMVRKKRCSRFDPNTCESESVCASLYYSSAALHPTYFCKHIFHSHLWMFSLDIMWFGASVQLYHY